MPTYHRLLAVTALLASLTPIAQASERRFVYSYETLTAPKGSIEIENWVTWKNTSVHGGRDLNSFQFRHELEYAITDRLQVGFYLFDWEYDRNASHDKARWEHSGVEFIYNLTNPSTDWLGSALYFEALLGEHEVEIEGKLLLEKRFANLRIAYNAILEAAFDKRDSSQNSGEFGQTLGVSYDLTKRFSLGAEALHEIELPRWDSRGDSVVYAGPNASWRFGRGYATLAALFQITSVNEEPDRQIRLITGFDF